MHDRRKGQFIFLGPLHWSWTNRKNEYQNYTKYNSWRLIFWLHQGNQEIMSFLCYKSFPTFAVIWKFVLLIQTTCYRITWKTVVFAKDNVYLLCKILEQIKSIFATFCIITSIEWFKYSEQHSSWNKR